MKALVITPTYNEIENIGLLIPQILAQDPCLEVLVVDDNSPDGTGQMADEMAAREPRIHVLHHTRKEGLGPAYIAGFKWALAYGADLIFEMDADFSHNPKYPHRRVKYSGMRGMNRDLWIDRTVSAVLNMRHLLPVLAGVKRSSFILEC